MAKPRADAILAEQAATRDRIVTDWENAIWLKSIISQDTLLVTLPFFSRTQKSLTCSQ